MSVNPVTVPPLGRLNEKKKIVLASYITHVPGIPIPVFGIPGHAFDVTTSRLEHECVRGGGSSPDFNLIDYWTGNMKVPAGIIQAYFTAIRDEREIHV